jgi:hypothetical protein
VNKYKHFKEGDIVRAIPTSSVGGYIDQLDGESIYKVRNIEKENWGMGHDTGENIQYTYTISNIKTNTQHYTRDEALVLANRCKWACNPCREEGCPFKEKLE